MVVKAEKEPVRIRDGTNVVPVRRADMYYCSNCGAAVPAGAERCPNCHGSFSGTGQGSGAQQAERQKQYREYQKADQVREKRRSATREASRRQLEAVGADP